MYDVCQTIQLIYIPHKHVFFKKKPIETKKNHLCEMEIESITL